MIRSLMFSNDIYNIASFIKNNPQRFYKKT